MVARTVKFMGTAYSTGSSISLNVEYNNAVVYSGTISATTANPLPLSQPNPGTADPIQGDVWADELFSFETDTSITGQIPMKITVTGGTLFFGHLRMNYSGQGYWIVDSNDPTQKTPVFIDPVEFFADPNDNTEESDGVSNTTKNGTPWTWRSSTGGIVGYYAYPVYDGEVFEFDFFVDSEKIKLTPWTSPT